MRLSTIPYGLTTLLALCTSVMLLAQKPMMKATDFGARSKDLRFEENKGQIADTEGNVRSDILFNMKDNGVNLFFTKGGISYQWHRVEELMEGPLQISEATGRPMNEEEGADRPDKFKKPKPTRLHTYRMDMQWIGASKDVEIIKEEPSADYNNYYHAHCPEGIHEVRSYSRITYKNLYPNVDVVYYVKEGHLKYDIVLNPGGNLKEVQIAYSGNTEMKQEFGELKLQTPFGFLTEGKPVAFRGNKPLKASYRIRNNRISFELENTIPGNDVIEPIIIDPELVWGTYYGGEADDYPGSVAADGSGNSYLVATTLSTSGISSGGHQNTFGGVRDSFLVKFSPDGTRLWATYYGGAGEDTPGGVAVDVSGNVYLTGSTASTTGIASSGYKNVLSGPLDAYLVKFSSTGVRQWATYYGGTDYDDASSIATDISGNVYIAGNTSSTTDIAVGGYQNANAGNNDLFVVKFTSLGVRSWGTYYGGANYDSGPSIATDNSGNIYLSGTTQSTSGIANGGHQNVFGGDTEDAFLVKFSSTGIRQWATYYGGSARDSGSDVDIDDTGNVYLVGMTRSTNAIASGGFQNTYAGDRDAFLVKFNSSGVRQWGTYYGGVIFDAAASVSIDASNNVYLGGLTYNTDGIASGGYQNTFGGNTDAFLIKFLPSGDRQWGSYYGGTDYDDLRGTAIDGLDNIFLIGYTYSANGIANGGYQNTMASPADSYLVKLTTTSNIPSIASFSPSSGPAGTSVVIVGTNFDPSPANNIVYFGATRASVTGATATSLTVTVPVGATYQPITVNTNGLIAYSSKPFVVTFDGAVNIDASSFDELIYDFATGQDPRQIAVADFDNDGKIDLAGSNYSDNTVSLFRNISSGAGEVNFAAKVDVGTGAGPGSISTADFDGDGKLDMVISNFNGESVSVLRNTSSVGTITFATKQDYPLSTLVSPSTVATGGFDNDGKADIVVVNLGNNTISVFLNTSSGTGTISFAPKTDIAIGASPNTVVTGDIDKDGKTDIVVASTNTTYISVLRNTSSGPGSVSFAALQNFTAIYNPQNLALGDLDGDDRLDVLVVNPENNTASVLRNTSSAGTVSFAVRNDFATGQNPLAAAIGDLNGDSKPDLAVNNFDFGTISVLKNISTGAGNIGFSPKVDFVTGPQSYVVVLGDCNGDGKSDLITNGPFNNTISVKLNSIASTLPFITTWVTTDGSITIPTIDGGYNYSVTWSNLTNPGVGEGSVSGQTGNYTITGLQNGSTYKVSISGDFPRIFFNSFGDALKIRSIEQWGDIVWTSFFLAFEGCSNLTVTATDVPDLSGVTDLTSMFYQCSSITTIPNINSWDVSSIKKTVNMFSGATNFNSNLSGWDVSSVTEMGGMFLFAANFNSDLSAWNVSGVTNMVNMFNGASSFNSNLSGWNVSSVTNMNGMFSSAFNFNSDLGSWNVSSVTNMNNMFSSSSSFTSNLGSWDISNVTDMDNMLYSSGMTQADYDATLIGWATLGAGETQIPSAITLGADGLLYCAGTAARQSLIDTYGWTITGDTENCGPIVTSVSSSTTDGTYGVGAKISVTVTFNKVVNVVGTPTLTLETGTTDRVVNYTSGSGTTTLIFDYTIQAGDVSADLDYLNTTTLALNGGTIKDAGDLDAILTLAAPAAPGSLGANNALVIDGIAPLAPSTPDLATSDDSGTSSIDNLTNLTTALTFAGTAESGATVNLYRAGSTLIGTGVATGGAYAIDVTLPAGTHTITAVATDVAGNIGTASTGLNVTVDNTPPSVTINQAGGQIDPTGTVPVTFTVVFSEDISGFIASDFTLGGTATGQSVTALTGGNITWNLSISATGSGTIISSITAGVVTDAAGNVNLASTSTDNSVTYNAPIAPIVTNVTSSSPDGSYGVGAIIPIQVTFSSPVTVNTGTPTITLETGTTDRVINYISGSGTNTLTFNYTVQSGDQSADLDYVANSLIANPLHKGSIQDGAGGSKIPGPEIIDISGNYAYIACSQTANAGLEIVNISNPSAPVHAGNFSLTSAFGVSVLGNYAYVTSFSGNSLNIVNVSNPAAPTLTGSLAIPSPLGLFVLGNYAYVTGSNSLKIINVSNPALPVLTGSITDGGAITLSGARAVYVSGNYAYVASQDDNALEIVNVSNPAGPVHAGSIVNGTGGAILGGAYGVFVSGNYAYVASNLGNALEIINISNPVNPTHAGSVAITAAQSVYVNGNTAYVASSEETIPGDALVIVDVSNPNVPVIKNTILNGVNGALLNDASSVKVVDGYAYVASWASNALEIIDVNPIRDASNVGATLTLPSPGASGSLGFNKAIVIDVIAPLAPSTPDLATADDIGASSTDNITAIDASLTLTGTAEDGALVTFTEAGLGVLGSVTATGGNYSFDFDIGSGTYSISATAEDAAGNVSPASGSLSITVDTGNPTVTINQAIAQADPTNTVPVSFDIVFNKAVNPSTFISTDITLGGSATGQSVSSFTSPSSDNINWVLTITATGPGTIIPSIAPGVLEDVAGNTNTASSNTDNSVTYCTITAPVVGIITQPTCTVPTGSVALSGLPAGAWTINPGAIAGSGTTTTLTLLTPATTFNYTVTETTTGCISAASANVVINAVPPAPTASVLSGLTTICSGGSTNFSVAITGGTSPYTVVYNDGTSNTTVNGYISGSNISVSPMTTTTYSLASVTSADGCASGGLSGTAVVTVNLLPTTSAAGNDQFLCNVTTSTLAGNSPVIGTGIWSVVSGTAIITTPSSPTSGLTGLILGATATLRWTITNGTCIASTDDVLIDVALTTPPVVGTITQPTCSTPTGSVVLNGLPSGTWLINPGAIAGSGTTTTLTLLAPSTTFVYNVTETTSTGCASSASADIVINAVPTTATPIVGTITQPTCTVPTGSVALSGLPAGAWTINPGSISGSGTTTTLTLLTPAKTFNYTVTETATGCISVASANVVINAVPATPVAPIVGAITQPTCTTPTGSVALSGLPAGAWTINPGALAGSGTTTTLTLLTPATTFNYTVTETATGCISTASANVVINAVPVAPAAPTASVTTQPTCNVASGTITVTVPANGTGVSYTVTGTSPVVAAQSNATGIFSGLAIGNYNVTATVSGCTSAATALTINPQPTVPSAPTATVTSQPSCIVATGTITVTVPSNGTGVSYTVTGTNPVILAQSNATGVFSGLAVGNYNVTTTVSGCTSSSTTLIVNPIPNAPVLSIASVIIVPTTVGSSNGSIDITGAVSGGSSTYSYQWYAGSGVSTPIIGGVNAKITSLAAGDYTVVATDLVSGCATTPQTFTIKTISLPTVISIKYQTPATSPTNATGLTFRVTFSENVVNVDAADFTKIVSGVSTGATVVTAVTGAIYDVAFPVAGNGTVRVDVLNTASIANAGGGAYASNFTTGQVYVIDQTPPVFSSTAPTSNSTVNNTQVSYTLSEALSSGTITWTRTGGAPDGASPHVQTLIGDELMVGPHPNITLTNNPALVPGVFYSVTFSGIDLAGNSSAPAVETNVTFTPLPGNLSDIVASSSFSYLQNINYALFQEAGDIQNSPTSLPVAKFDIRDGGASGNDTDPFPTILTGITLDLGANFSLIRRIALYDASGTNELAATDKSVGSQKITFSNLSISANDNALSSLIIRVSFADKVTDNQQFSFTVTEATSLIGNSTFATANAGGASSSTSNNNNKIEVTATQLRFVQQPTNTIINNVMAPAVTVQSIDAFGNIDLDFSGTVNITSQGVLGSAVNASILSGLGTSSDIIFSNAGTGLTLITTNNFSLSNATSESFDVYDDTEGIELVINSFITPNKADNQNNVLYIQNIEFFPENTVKLIDRWGVPIKSWTNFSNYISSDAEQADFDFNSLSIGNYICIVEYKNSSNGDKKNHTQMISVLK